MTVINYGFVDIYGIIWQKEQVDLYNKVSAEIDSRLRNGFSVSDDMLDNRHRIYHIPLYSRCRNEKKI